MIDLVGAILTKRGRVLLGLRAAHKSFPRCWDIFGGHVEPGETPWDALSRELVEELGVKALAGSQLEAISLDLPNEGPSLLHLFHVRAWAGEPRLASDEHTELGWIPLEAAQALPNLALAEYRTLFAALSVTPS